MSDDPFGDLPRIPGLAPVSLLGQGGMGRVFLCKQTKLRRHVVVKVLLVADGPSKALFLREAQAMAAINHPNVVVIHEVGAAQDFIVMEFVEGETLRRRIQRGRLAIGEAVRLVRDAAAGLDAALKMGIVHRDVKPENLLLSLDGRLKVADFGLARPMRLEDGQGLTTEIRGTPAYISPEQLQQIPVDHRCDIYALGIVFFEMLTGTKPFEGDWLALAYAHLNQSLPDLAAVRPEAPKHLVQLIRSMTAKSRDDRPRDYEALLRALDGVQIPVEPPLEPTVELGEADREHEPQAGTQMLLRLWADVNGGEIRVKYFPRRANEEPYFAITFKNARGGYPSNATFRFWGPKPLDNTLPSDGETASSRGLRHRAICLSARIGDASSTLIKIGFRIIDRVGRHWAYGAGMSYFLTSVRSTEWKPIPKIQLGSDSGKLTWVPFLADGTRHVRGGRPDFSEILGMIIEVGCDGHPGRPDAGHGRVDIKGFCLCD